MFQSFTLLEGFHCCQTTTQKHKWCAKHNVTTVFGESGLGLVQILFSFLLGFATYVSGFNLVESTSSLGFSLTNKHVFWSPAW